MHQVVGVRGLEAGAAAAQPGVQAPRFQPRSNAAGQAGAVARCAGTRIQPHSGQPSPALLTCLPCSHESYQLSRSRTRQRCLPGRRCSPGSWSETSTSSNAPLVRRSTCRAGAGRQGGSRTIGGWQQDDRLGGMLHGCKGSALLAAGWAGMDAHPRPVGTHTPPPAHLSHHRLVLHGVEGAGGVDQAAAHAQQLAGAQRDAQLDVVQAVARPRVPLAPDVGSLAQRAVACGWRGGGKRTGWLSSGGSTASGQLSVCAAAQA